MLIPLSPGDVGGPGGGPAPTRGPRRPSRPILLRDPERLHRILARVLVPPDGPTDAHHAVANSAVQVFEPLRSELGLQAIAVYALEGDEVRLQQQVGGLEGEFRSPLPAAAVNALVVPSRRVVVFPDPYASGTPAAIGMGPRTPIAIRIVEAASVRYLLVAALAPDTEAAAVEFVLGIVGTVVAARAMRERWRQSLDEAEEIQRELLPSSLPTLDGFEIAARSVPAEVIGGDFYDFLDLGAGRTGIAVGDAVGHGLSAALVARDVVVGLRVALDRRRPVASVLVKLNRVLRAGLPGRAFASLFYVELRPDGRFDYVSAGHPPGVCLGVGGPRVLRRGGPVLGPFEDAAFRRMRSQLHKGEVLVLYTDGIVERRDPQGAQFSEDRLLACVASDPDAPLSARIEHVFRQATDFGGGAPWSDDATLVLVRRTA